MNEVVHGLFELECDDLHDASMSSESKTTMQVILDLDDDFNHLVDPVSDAVFSLPQTSKEELNYQFDHHTNVVRKMDPGKLVLDKISTLSDSNIECRIDGTRNDNGNELESAVLNRLADMILHPEANAGETHTVDATQPEKSDGMSLCSE